MDFKYNFSFCDQYEILFVYTHIFPINKLSEKEFKLIFQQYLIKCFDLKEFQKLKNIYINNILSEKNNVLIIKVDNKIDDQNAFNKFWFYTNTNNIFNEITDSYNNKLKILNGKLYEYLVSDFKFRDIFILLYKNE